MTPPPGVTRASHLAALVRRIGDDVDELATLVTDHALADVAAPALPDLVADLLRAADRSTALATVTADRLERSGELVPRGHRTVTHFLTHELGMSASHAGGFRSTMRQLRRYDDLGKAWVAGTVTGDAARVLMAGVEKAIADIPPHARHTHRVDAAALLLPVATHRPVADLVAAAALLEHVIDPESKQQRALLVFEQQFLTVSRVADEYVVNGSLDVETGAALSTVLDRLRDQRYRDGVLADDRPGPDTGDPELDDAIEDRRRRLAAPHQNALSLAHLVRTWLENGGLGSHHGVKPHLTLLVTATDLAEGLPAELDVPGESSPALVPAETVRRLLCDAEISETVVAGSVPTPGCALPDASTRLLPRRHHVWDEGRRYRTASPRLRRALEARDRHCAFTGCRVGIAWCEAHHVLEWERGGITSIDNMTLLCARHHHTVHEGGWRITASPRHDAGHPDHWTFHAPDPLWRA